MADAVMASSTSTGGDFAICPDGSAQGVCVDVIDLGEKVEQFQDNPAKLVHKIALVFQVEHDNPDTGKPFEPWAEFTLSFHEKATLRKFLATWRGRPYTEEEAAKGVPLDKLEGHNGIVAIQHVPTKKGRTFAKLASVQPLLPKMVKIGPIAYERAPFWETRKAEYKQQADEFRARYAPKPGKTPDEVLASVDEDDSDLPF
jgi:hypothetical protein